MSYPSTRSWVRMRSESTRAFGQPRLTKPTLGLRRDMENPADGSRIVYQPRRGTRRIGRTRAVAGGSGGHETQVSLFLQSRTGLLRRTLCKMTPRPRRGNLRRPGLDDRRELRDAPG